MPRVLCVGHAVQDFVFGVPELPLQPVKYGASSFTSVGGGPAATAAVAIARLDSIPFDALREIAERSRSDESAPTDAFDPDSPAVHVWGPVMVVPSAGEETAHAVERVARDPGAAGVSVVVIDLAGVIVDAEAPLSEMFGYSTQVRSLSQGRASYSMEPLRFDAAPPHILREMLGG